MENQHLLTDIAIFLMAAVVSVPISKKLGFGAVLGYLIAGVVIGPWGFRFITEPQGLLHFSEFGVVMFLFLVGLDLNPKKLWSLKHDILGTGLAQLFFSGLLLGLIAFFITKNVVLSFLVGTSLALSSTAIALQSFEEKNLLQSPEGQKGFSILLFQDLAVIPLLAIIPLITSKIELDSLSGVSSSSSFDIFRILKPVLVILGIIALGKLLVRPFFRLIASTGSREVFTAASLLLVVGIAVVTDLTGLSMALGTFLAGVLLADSEYRHELEADIEPFKALLLGLFFISVGMSLDLKPLLEMPFLVMACLFALFASKILVLVFVGKIRNLNWAQSIRLGVTLSQASEFAFVIFGVAKNSKVLNQDQISLLNVTVTLSMLLTPVLVLCFESISKILSPEKNESEKKPDTFEGLVESHVIIAGFGRYGQIVARLLHSCHFQTTVLDQDPTHIEMLRKFGFHIYYGDASRMDLLEKAGINKAKIFVCAIDDQKKSLETVSLVKKHYPHVAILSRCRNLSHLFELEDLKIDYYSRETFASALELGKEVLRRLGFTHYRALTSAQKFKKIDEKGNLEFTKIIRSGSDFVSLAKQSRTQLEAQLKAENATFVENRDSWWN